MINLIPIEGQKRMIKGFYLRFIIVFAFLFSFCMFVALVSLIPSYFLANNKEKDAQIKLEIQKNEPMPKLDQETLALIKDIDSKLTIVENSNKNKFLVSEKVINQIMSSKMPDIKINRISFERDVVSDKKVSIYGTAPSRERLLLFRKALEENSAFLNVDLPVSNFIKGENIEFYLSLTSL
jgi:hypothetical protein